MDLWEGIKKVLCLIDVKWAGEHFLFIEFIKKMYGYCVITILQWYIALSEWVFYMCTFFSPKKKVLCLMDVKWAGEHFLFIEFIKKMYGYCVITLVNDILP